MNRTFPTLLRFGRIFWICAYHLSAYVISHKLNRFRLIRWLKLTESLSGPQRLRIALQEMDGTFIKFGQVLALQSDILPLDYCRELFNLLDRVPAFPFADVESTFLRDLGRRPQEIFDSFAADPIATGSIAQVHVATLGDRKLAIKVRRPTAFTDFGSDIRLMMFIVNLITILRLKFLYWMIAPTTEFVTWTLEELDFRREARYMDVIAKNAANNPREAVPRVFWEYTTECILCTEFLEGLTVLEYMRARDERDVSVLCRLESNAFDPSAFAKNLIDNFLGDAFQYGMFHADLHPANLMILSSSRVGYIDFGIAGVLSPYSRQHLVAMTLAYARGELDQMCDSFFQVSAMDGRSQPVVFRARLKELAQKWYIKDGEAIDLRKSITAIMLELLTLSRATGIWPQRDVVKYIRSAIALDGLIKSFAPGFNVGHHLETVCDRHLHWHSIRNLLSPGNVISWLDAGSRLARDGVSRTLEMITQLGSRQGGADPGTLRGPDGSASVRIAAVALFASIVAVAPAGEMIWGLNVRSAGILLAVASMLVALWKMGPDQRPRHIGDTPPHDIDGARRWPS